MVFVEQARPLEELVRGAPEGGELRLPPGRYLGPLVLDRGLVVRGSGDLTRISLPWGTGGSVVRVSTPEPVVLESLLLEGGRATRGGGIAVREGHLRVFNVQIRRCAASETGGGLDIAGGVVDAERLRFFELEATRGGAIAVADGAQLRLRDSEIRRVEASFGGALSMSAAARVRFEAVTAARCLAQDPRGGHVVGIRGGEGAHLSFERVRFEGTPFGPLVVNEQAPPARFEVVDCDLPRAVRDARGLTEVGESRWR